MNRDITPYDDAPLTDCDTGPWCFMVDSNNHIKLRRLALFPVELMKLNLVGVAGFDSSKACKAPALPAVEALYLSTPP